MKKYLLKCVALLLVGSLVVACGKDENAQIPRVEPVLKEIEAAAGTVCCNDGNHADGVENAETIIRPVVEMK